MLDIIELEKRLLDTINTFVTQFDENNIILLPTNIEEIPKPYLGIQTIELFDVGRPIEYGVDEATGNRTVTQHYEWKVRFKTVGLNDANRVLITSSTALMQELILKMSTQLFRDELECYSIHLRRVNGLSRMPQLIADEWVDQTCCDVIFGLADQTTEFVSFIETVEITRGEFARSPDDPNPIEITP